MFDNDYLADVFCLTADKVASCDGVIKEFIIKEAQKENQTLITYQTASNDETPILEIYLYIVITPSSTLTWRGNTC